MRSLIHAHSFDASLLPAGVLSEESLIALTGKIAADPDSFPTLIVGVAEEGGSEILFRSDSGKQAIELLCINHTAQPQDS